QKLTINTDPPGADCTLTQTGMTIGHVNPTPGVVEVRRGGDTLQVSCVKEGYGDAASLNRPGLEAMTFGNILIGGVVGIVVDAASGANRKYDSVMNIPLAPTSANRPATGAVSTVAAPVPRGNYERYESATAEFHCPAAGTLIRTSANVSFKFTDGKGMICGYLDQYGAARQRYAIFADGFGRLAKHDLDALWPLKVGNRVEFVVVDNSAPSLSGAWQSLDYEEKFTVVGVEPVTVPAGTFDTFVVEWREKGTRGAARSEAIITSWYAPRTGYIVKSSVKVLERSAADPFANSQYFGLDYEATEIVVPTAALIRSRNEP
ncbi:MAG: hypothetical protein ACM3O6_02375, partial [Acidobacteriota bacterium]